MKIKSAALQNWIVPVTVLVIWETLGRTGHLPRYLPAPTVILAAFRESASTSELWVALGVSLTRVALGFAIGMTAGVFVGLCAGLVPTVRNFFDPLVSFLFAVPKIAFLPVFLLLFGLGLASKVAIIAFAVFFPVFIASRHAPAAINPLFVWSARNMGASRVTIFLCVILPALAPQLFTGIRIGLAHAFVVLFAAELIGATAGLGLLISDGEDAGRFDLMFVGIFCFAIMGFLADRALMRIRGHVLRGQLLGTEERVAQ